MKTGRLLFVILNCITLSTIYITSWTNCNSNLLDELSIDDAPQTLQSDRFHVIDSGDSNRDDDDGYNVNEFELAESRGKVRRKNYHGKNGKINRDDGDESDVNEFELAERRGEVVRKRYHGKKGKIAWLMRYVCDPWLAFFVSVRAFLHDTTALGNKCILLLQVLLQVHRMSQSIFSGT
jgi:hypothetical protein